MEEHKWATYLVVELDVVPVNKAPDLFINFGVSTGRVFGREPRSKS